MRPSTPAERYREMRARVQEAERLLEQAVLESKANKALYRATLKRNVILNEKLRRRETA